MVPDFIWNRIEKWLRLRPHSEWEIRLYVSMRIKKWQKRAKINENDVLAFIKKMGCINDEAFARWWAEGRIEFRRFGPMKIRSELMQKHVDRALIDEVIAEIVKPVEGVLIKEWREKIAVKKPEWDKRKVTNYLMRKGFAYDTIS